MEEEAKVLQSDPLNLLYRRLYAVALGHTGRWGEAETEIRRVLDMEADDQAWAVLAMVYHSQGRSDEALRYLLGARHIRCRRFPPGPITGQMAGLLARAGKGARAASLVDSLRSAQSEAAIVGLAVYYALPG